METIVCIICLTILSLGAMIIANKDYGEEETEKKGKKKK